MKFIEGGDGQDFFLVTLANTSIPKKLLVKTIAKISILTPTSCISDQIEKLYAEEAGILLHKWGKLKIVETKIVLFFVNHTDKGVSMVSSISSSDGY